MPIETVGFIGLGTMGAAMAANVQRGGYALRVFDLVPETAEPLVEGGAVACTSAGDAALGADAVITMVPDSPEVEAAVLGPDGVLSAAAPGTLVIDMSTIDPAVSQSVGAQVVAAGCRFLDAPVCRSSEHAVTGELMVLVGGEPADYEEALPLLQTMGSTFYHCGPVGAGATLKVLNNTLGQGIALAVCEVLTLGVKAGLTLERMIEVFSDTAAGNRLMENAYAGRAFKGDFSLGFALDWAHKDVGHGLKLGARMNVPLPAAALVHQFQALARQQGKGRLDHSALLTVFEELAGVQVRSSECADAKG